MCVCGVGVTSTGSRGNVTEILSLEMDVSSPITMAIVVFSMLKFSFGFKIDRNMSLVYSTENWGRHKNSKILVEEC